MPISLLSATHREVPLPNVGRLILVVGPSGSGKDTLLDAARVAFAGRSDIHFARRDITRPASAGGEKHREISVVQFEEALSAGEYPLHWDAHQLRYGVRRAQLEPLALGVSVVLNGSRSIIDEVLASNTNAHVLSIRVGREILQERLQNRGREGDAAVQARLDRAMAFDVAGEHVTEIWNEGSAQEGCAKFVSALERLLAEHA